MDLVSNILALLLKKRDSGGDGASNEVTPILSFLTT